MLVILIIVVLYLLSLFTPLDVLGLRERSSPSPVTSSVAQRSEWQAVFLGNGQVYFGRIENEKSDPVILRDIYYLQVIQPLQQREGEAQQQPQLSLVELGNELHGPLSEMRINRQHILFIEDLKSTGKVVEAIERSRAQKQAKE